MTETIETLGDALPRDIERAYEIRAIYLDLQGGAGHPAASMMQASINAAKSAISNNDVAAMQRSTSGHSCFATARQNRKCFTSSMEASDDPAIPQTS